MKYNKKFYTNNGQLDIEDCAIEQVWACDCPYRIADYLTEKYGKYPYGWSLQEELEIGLDNVDWID
jgi:hypothetical protein